MKLTYIAVGVLSLGACTPTEIEQWHAWHAQAPAAAEAFLLRPEVQEQLAHHAADDRSDDRSTADDRSVWDRVAECESGGDWSINTGNGYYGGLQFALSSWRATGGTGYPHQHSRAEQIRRAEILLDMQGWQAWPTCSRRLGLR